MHLVINTFVVFALTLILTKSKVLAGKREFVEKRFDAAKVGNQQPGWVHKIWHAIWTCPMCSGFWIAIPICGIYPVYGIFVDVLVIFGANWIVHCLENLLFFSGKIAEGLDEDLDEIDLPKIVSSGEEFLKKANKVDLLRLLEKNLRKSLDRRD